MPLARHLDRPVVLERFSREVARLRDCRHPHIVPIVDDGRDDNGRPFIVMRFLPGGSLADRKKPVNLVTLHRWLPGIAAALDYIHSQGVLHRDVKPSNIFFDTQANAFLGDFGIARLIDEAEDSESAVPLPPETASDFAQDREDSLTLTGQLMGTLPYMAPELFEDRPHLTPKADQYSLAVAVYELLSCSWPVKESDREAFCRFHRGGRQSTPLLSRIQSVPVSLANAVAKALAKSPDDRFGDCREFAAAVLAEVPFSAIDPSHRRFLCPECKRLVRVPDDFGGRSCRCPSCQRTLRVSQGLDALWRPDEDPRPSAHRHPHHSPKLSDHAINEILKEDEETLFRSSYQRFASKSMWPAAAQLLSTEVLRRIDSQGSNSISTAAVMGKLAAVTSRNKDFEAAERLYKRALAVASQSGPQHLLTADIAFDLATLHRSRQQWQASTRLYAQALKIRQAVLGSHPFIANCWGSLAVVLGLQGQVARAEPLLVKALTAYGANISEPHGSADSRFLLLAHAKLQNILLEVPKSATVMQRFFLADIHAFAEHFDDGRKRIFFPP